MSSKIRNEIWGQFSSSWDGLVSTLHWWNGRVNSWSVFDLKNNKEYSLSEWVDSQELKDIFDSYKEKDLSYQTVDQVETERKYKFMGLTVNETIIFNFLNKMLESKFYLYNSNTGEELHYYTCEDFIYGVY